MVSDPNPFRCCGRKPLTYKTARHTGTPPHFFCATCDRAYDLETRQQIPNWAWTDVGGIFERTRP